MKVLIEIERAGNKIDYPKEEHDHVSCSPFLDARIGCPTYTHVYFGKRVSTTLADFILPAETDKCIENENRLSGVPAGTHEVEPLARQAHFALVEVAPDAHRRQVGERAPEGFDGQPAVIVVGFQGGEGLLPAQQAFPRRAPVVLGDVDVGQDRREGSNGSADAPLLDVGVEGVVHSADMGVCYGIHQAPGILRNVEKVALEAVESLDGQGHVRL